MTDETTKTNASATPWEAPSAASGLATLQVHAFDAGRGLARAAASGAKLLAALFTLSPLAVVLALAALGVAWFEHDLHLRQSGELNLLKRQTASDISQLQSKAADEVKAANQEHASQVVSLELERQKLERDQESLRQRLSSLESAGQSKAAQAAAESAPEVASGLATRLGLQPADFAAAPQTPATVASPGGSGAATTGAPSAGASSQDPGAAGESSDRSSSGTGRSKSPAPMAGQAILLSPAGTDGFTLSEPALRKMSGALDQLDSCRAESALRDGLVSNCQAQTKTSAAIIDQQRASLTSLNQALADKDQIITKRDQEHQTELKIARGTFMGRVVRTLEHVAIGVAIGYALKR